MSRAVLVVLVVFVVHPLPCRAADEALLPAAAPRPAPLMPLYATNVALQGFDIYSTLTVVGGHGAERNPFVGGLVDHQAAFVAVKGGVTVASIVTAEHLWKNGHRTAAVAMFAVVNAVMTMVAVNNAREMRRVR